MAPEGEVPVTSRVTLVDLDGRVPVIVLLVASKAAQEGNRLDPESDAAYVSGRHVVVVNGGYVAANLVPASKVTEEVGGAFVNSQTVCKFAAG